MIQLFRFSLPLIISGLIAGLILRMVLGRERLRSILLIATGLPILIHAGFSVGAATNRADVGSAAALFGVLTLVLLALVLWLGARLVRSQPVWAFAVPLAATALYLLVRYLALELPMQAQSARLDLIPTLVLLGTVIFVAAALLVYAPRIPQLRMPNPLRWFRRR
jgi:hypothetical protein